MTGRITGLAADAAGHVYAAGADGGVWRSSTGGGAWTPIADGLASLSSGALEIDKDGALWYATGEANTGGTSYVGNGVYRLADPTTGTLTPANRVGGTELESTTINAVRFTADKAWIATLRGVYWHERTGDMTTPWHFSFAPNPTFLPGGADASNPNAAYKNIVNDIGIDPKDPNHLIAAIGWRSGDTYNGFYESTDGGTTWVKINPTGAINPKDIGNVSFGYSGDGSKLYVDEPGAVAAEQTGRHREQLSRRYLRLEQRLGRRTVDQDRRLAQARQFRLCPQAEHRRKGLRPRHPELVQPVPRRRPGGPEPSVAGLEEVYETTNGGSSWNTVGPYWNFYFPCWAPDSVYPPNGTPNRCPQTTHPDQHSAAVGTVDGKAYLFVGNDGGIYRRPLHGTGQRERQRDRLAEPQ